MQTNTVTDSFIKDRLYNIDYKPLSRKQEIDMIKKLKLSYYDEVDDSLKELYLNYYFEEFPNFKEKYENADNKEELLEKAIENSTQYRDFFINNNSRLVVLIVNQFAKTNKNYEDMYQNGMIGLMRALEKFDLEKETKFSTYAMLWVKQEIIRQLHNNKRVIRIPVHFSERIYKYERLVENYRKELGRTPTDEELMAEMDLNEEQLKDLIRINYCCHTSSLDEPVDTDSRFTVGELVFDDDDFTQKTIDSIYFSQIYDIIEKMDFSFLEKQILSMHYGLNDGEVYSYAEIAKELNMRKEKVKEIEKVVFRRLKYNIEMIKLNSESTSSFAHNKVLHKYK
ncbi:MAG: sigma-70 family RNA polymerase sigma factor [Bacilli bacterium]|nr:sigma-70 family RNA polymerase sigma factor [Bacilli bacterium]